MSGQGESLTKKLHEAEGNCDDRSDQSEAVGNQPKGLLVREIPANTEHGGGQSPQDVLNRDEASAETVSHCIHHDEPPFVVIGACLVAPLAFGLAALVTTGAAHVSMMASTLAWAITATALGYGLVGGLHMALIAGERRLNRSGFQSLFEDQTGLLAMRSLRVPFAMLAAGTLMVVEHVPTEIAAMLGGGVGVACAWSDLSGWVRRSRSGGGHA